MGIVAVFAAMLPVSCVSAASAQTFVPLSQTPSDSEETYAFVRCAGFYQANVEWAGKDRMNEAEFEAIDASIRNLSAIAVLLRKQKSGTTDSNIKSVKLDARKIADIYVERYRNSYALTGNAWSSDELWLSDLETCKVIAEKVNQRFGG